MVDAVLDSVFDEPLDVRSAAEAQQLLRHQGDPSRWGIPAAAAEWSLARRLATGAATLRGGRRLAAKFGSKTAGRAVLPLTLATEVGLAARVGRRELQVLASYLIHRLREAGLPVERDLVRRAVTALYLEPRRRPDLGRSGPALAGAVARRWIGEIVPGFGRRSRQINDRIRAVERLDLRQLVADWRVAVGAPSLTDGG